MAFPNSSLGNLSLSFKLALISAGVVSFAVILKISILAVTDLAVSEVPVMYSSVLSWLRPPYIYLIINGIIISIVASSKLKVQKADESFKQPVNTHAPTNAAVADKIPADLSTGFIEDLNAVGKFIEGDSDEIANPSKIVQPPLRSESIEELLEKLEKEKPLFSKRFGHKKSVNASNEGGKASATVLGVSSKSKRHDTLENTWKKITDGRPIPLNRHLKKSEMNPPPAQQAEKMKKSETCNDKEWKRKESGQGSGKVRKEASLSEEELNRRVEAFINKFNEEMRLQREESLKQYQEMIGRGAY